MELLNEGRRIGDSYEVERFLGQGAFAQVYRVQHRFLGRQAMKVFKRVGTPEQTEEMLGEAILLSKIGHPNIVRVFDAGTVETARGRCGFFTMEYVAGGNLWNFWQSHEDRRVGIADAVRILGQICGGLAVAHGKTPPIIHRDITPQNILVGYDRDGLRVRVSDFGLARQVDLLTGLASAKGTLAFKAPETLRYGRGDSPAGDVWAVGMIAYLLLTDTLPYSDTRSPITFFGAPRSEALEAPRAINSDVDEDLSGIVLAALEPNPRNRIRDAAELGKALSAWESRGPADPGEHTPRAAAQVLGHRPRVDEEEARGQAARALTLAHQAGSLREAADLLEEACNRSARVRSEYEPRLRLWRKGVVG